MKNLRDYITEVENLQPGDEFDIELAPDQLVESYVIESGDDYVVIDSDDVMIGLLESHGHILEDIKRYGPAGSNNSIGYSLGEDQTCMECGYAMEACDCDHVDEGSMKDIDIERQDLERMNPQQFYAAYKMSKDDWKSKHKDLLEPQSQDHAHWDFGRILELAGVADHEFNKQDDVYSEDNSGLLDKSVKDAPVGAMGELPESEEINDEDLDEAEYQGRNVPLGKPMRGDVKKFKVYVKDPKTGNVKKVNFGHGGTSAKRAGQKTMKIKKSNPARRKSFRARHNCANPGPRTKARYWSCRAW